NRPHDGLPHHRGVHAWRGRRHPARPHRAGRVPRRPGAARLAGTGHRGPARGPRRPAEDGTQGGWLTSRPRARPRPASWWPPERKPARRSRGCGTGGARPHTALQSAMFGHGRVLADVASGVAAPQTAKPVSPGTLFYAASAAKGVAAALAHVLAERGDITYDLRLAGVWPEFAARGKRHTTLRHVLLHTAGLPGLPQETTVADLCAWDRVCAALAAADPWWRPGTRFGYHALTFGFLLGETLRRATGRTMTR